MIGNFHNSIRGLKHVGINKTVKKKRNEADEELKYLQQTSSREFSTRHYNRYESKRFALYVDSSNCFGSKTYCYVSSCDLTCYAPPPPE